MSIADNIKNISQKNCSIVSVGLDSSLAKIPSFLKDNKRPSEIIFNFNKAIVDSTFDLVCAYKPNIAFYEAEGIEGMRALRKTVAYIKGRDKDIIVICDAKRADIGNTNVGYIKAIFEYFQFDAITVNPYLGEEALEPFLSMKDKGIIVLCRTSNPGAGEFQDLMVKHPDLGNTQLYKAVAFNVAAKWNNHKNCGLVVGATYPAELAEVRRIVKNIPLLIPGVGAQGGDIKKTVLAGQDNKGGGLIINSSRGIIFASSERDFAEAARMEANKLKLQINKWRKKHDKKK